MASASSAFTAASISSPPAAPTSALYKQLFALAKRHAQGDKIMSLRSADAVHRWGHARLVSLNRAALGKPLDNEGLCAHLRSTGRLLASCKGKIYDIMVDEHQRKATVWMSYLLETIVSKDEVVENDLIWTLRFTDHEALEDIRIKESVGFIDAAASARANAMLREAGIDIDGQVRGGLAVAVLQ